MDWRELLIIRKVQLKRYIGGVRLAVKVRMPKPVKTQRVVTENSMHNFDRSPEEVLLACKYLVKHNDKYKRIVRLKKDMTDGEEYEFNVIYNNKVLSSLHVKIYSLFDETGSIWEYETDVPFYLVNTALRDMSSPNIDEFISQVEEILNSGIPLEDEGKSKSWIKYIVVIFIIVLLLYLLIRL